MGLFEACESSFVLSFRFTFYFKVGSSFSAFFKSDRFSNDANLSLLYFLQSNLFKTSLDTKSGFKRSLISFCGGSFKTLNSYNDL